MNATEIYQMAERFYRAVTKTAKKPSAGFLFFCPEDRTVFLTHRSAHMSSPGTWDIPGGRPEDFDNSPIETAVREVYEELGTTPKSKSPKGTHTIKTDEHHYIVYLMPLSLTEKEKFTNKLSLSDENDEYHWFDYDDIPTNTHFNLSWIPSEIQSLESGSGEQEAQ